MTCGIEQAADSNQRGDRVVEVGEEIRDRTAHRARRDLHVSARDWPEHCVVERAVE
jgi:hypothetical protein